MKKILACVLIIFGTAYASYSGICYIKKRLVVQEFQPQPFVKKTISEIQPKAFPWVVFSKEQHPKKGEHFADLIIPRFNLQIPIVEGSNPKELKKGAGHYSGSVLPGEPDNCVISGHRDTIFRQLGELKKKDEIRIQMQIATFIYLIENIWVTSPKDKTVIVSHNRPVLTIMTCYPFNYVGPSPKRYIIQAKLIEKIANEN